MQPRSDHEKLAILLKHWVEHNGGHAREFRRWAAKARELGRAGVSEDVEQAAQQMNEANQFLLAALKKLEAP